MKLWCIRDKETSKFVSNLTNPRKKFWEKKKSAESALKFPNRHVFKGKIENLELVEFDLIEVKL